MQACTIIVTGSQHYDVCGFFGPQMERKARRVLLQSGV